MDASVNFYLYHCTCIGLVLYLCNTLLLTFKQFNIMEVKKGDVIVMGSDGLFDNVFDHEIVNIVTKHTDVAESCMHSI